MKKDAAPPVRKTIEQKILEWAACIHPSWRETPIHTGGRIIKFKEDGTPYIAGRSDLSNFVP